MSKEQEYDTRQDLLIIQDGQKVAFGEILEKQEDETTFNYNIKVTKGTLLPGEHKTQILRPFDIDTDCMPHCLS